VDGATDVIGATGIAKIAPDLQVQQDGAADSSLRGGDTQRRGNLNPLQ
jgi:hypothetical protein